MTGKQIKLLLDEHVWEGLSAVLANAGYDVLHLNHTGKRGSEDDTVLIFASEQGRAVLTYNTRHFVPLAREWYDNGREHTGVVLSSQIPQGVLLRSTRNLLNTLTAPELHNSVRWLSEFSDE